MAGGGRNHLWNPPISLSRGTDPNDEKSPAVIFTRPSNTQLPVMSTLTHFKI